MALSLGLTLFIKFLPIKRSQTFTRLMGFVFLQSNRLLFKDFIKFILIGLDLLLEPFDLFVLHF